MLANVADRTVETEFSPPCPRAIIKGYHRKYVVVLGTVMSGLGKGHLSSSAAKLLGDKGARCRAHRFEGYLNIDASTLNPFRHGEVFVLDDGTECDMDLGIARVACSTGISRRNFATSGQVFSTIIERERRVPRTRRAVIPHVTGRGEAPHPRTRHARRRQKPADVVFIEVGGTVGDYENGFYIEGVARTGLRGGARTRAASSQRRTSSSPRRWANRRAKAAQLGIKRLMEAASSRTSSPAAAEEVGEQVREKIAMFSNVPMRASSRCTTARACTRSPTTCASRAWTGDPVGARPARPHEPGGRGQEPGKEWASFVDTLSARRSGRSHDRLAGKYVAMRDAYASIDKAVEHVGAHLGADLAIAVDRDDRRHAPERPRAPQRPRRADRARRVRHAWRGRQDRLRSARASPACPSSGSAWGSRSPSSSSPAMSAASPTPTRPSSGPRAYPVISELPEQKKIEGLGGTMRPAARRSRSRAGTLAEFPTCPSLGWAARCHGARTHRRPVVGQIAGAPLHDCSSASASATATRSTPSSSSGSSSPACSSRASIPPADHADARTVPGCSRPTERGDGAAPARRRPAAAIVHPFFIAGQFHPELTGRPLRPQPLFMGLVAAALRASSRATTRSRTTRR